VTRSERTCNADDVETTNRRRSSRLSASGWSTLLSSGEAPSLEWDELRNLPYDGVGCRDPATVAAEQEAMKPIHPDAALVADQVPLLGAPSSTALGVPSADLLAARGCNPERRKQSPAGKPMRRGQIPWAKPAPARNGYRK
jgi:hypothetical protein